MFSKILYIQGFLCVESFAGWCQSENCPEVSQNGVISKMADKMVVFQYCGHFEALVFIFRFGTTLQSILHIKNPMYTNFQKTYTKTPTPIEF